MNNEKFREDVVRAIDEAVRKLKEQMLRDNPELAYIPTDRCYHCGHKYEPYVEDDE